MSTLTPTLSIPRPAGSDPPNFAGAIQAAVDKMDALGWPIAAMSTVTRDALAAGDRPNGRIIYNTTTVQFEARFGGAWVRVALAAGTVVKVAWNYTLPGDIKVPVGQVDYLPYAMISVPSGQGVSLVGYQWFLSSGTSFTFRLRHRTGSTLATATTLASGIVAASASVKGAGTFTTQVCADADAWQLDITAISGTPNGGTVAMLALITV